MFFAGRIETTNLHELTRQVVSIRLRLSPQATRPPPVILFYSFLQHLTKNPQPLIDLLACHIQQRDTGYLKIGLWKAKQYNNARQAASTNQGRVPISAFARAR